MIVLARSHNEMQSVLHHLEWQLAWPRYEFTPPAPRMDEAYDQKLLSYHLICGALYFNELLPYLMEYGFDAIEPRVLFHSQRVMERTLTTHLCLDFVQHIESCEPPYRRAAYSRSGGKARAEKLYGQTKAYTKKRFEEMRGKGTQLSMSQIAQKISYELEQQPIAGDEPLSNPYDTIYRWVRVLNKRTSA